MTLVAALGDLHVGAHHGCNPPHVRDMLAMPKQNEEIWGHIEELRDMRPDVVLDTGDNIDGRGRRQGGRDIFEPDLLAQTDMAASVLKFIMSKNPDCQLFGASGTPYHIGDDCEDYDREVYKKAGAVKSGVHEWIDVDGVTFNLKHKIGNTSTPVGNRPMKREKVWELLWNVHQNHPASDVILRGHVHAFDYTGGVGWLGMTLPALCGLGSDYGKRQCSGEVHFGWVLFDCDKGSYTCSFDEYVWALKTSAPRVTKVKRRKK
jgi:hypothetical protein